MIITKSWLNDWLELEDISLDKIAKTLNCIGIEVNKINVLKVPDKIVVGYVKEKIKHANSDKLNICQVSIGDETLQIVCGADNVDAGQFVAVATKGAIMPNNMQIQEVQLRGVDSCGMLCSSTELGFNKINNGIMLLDESIGELELGRALNTYEIFNDGLIEVELTPNRGDCLSIYGVARDLATALNLNLKEPKVFKENENVLGIGRILRLAAEKELNGLYNYRAIELKNSIKTNLLLSLRLSQIENLSNNPIENLLNYATHSTGVLFNAYDLSSFSNEGEEFTIVLNKQEHGETKVSCKDRLLSFSGIFQNDESKCKKDSKIIIIEANYTDPLVIANAKNYHQNQDEKTLYRSFRGSEPKLSLGMDFLLGILENISSIIIYSSSQQIVINKQSPIIPVSIEGIGKMIGQSVDKDEILKILKKLGFELILSGEGLVNVKAPLHRPDIKNLSDICEEVVRIIGIDNIASRGLKFMEKNRFNTTYKNYAEFLNLRKKAVANGYFESLHYILDNEEELSNLGFDLIDLKLINPITTELNTLRTTLLNHLLNAASLNAKNSKKIIKLFELGIVFNKNNQEANHIAFIHSGFKEEAKISNKAKPQLVQFYDFLLDVKNIIGDFTLQASEHDILSPYEQADVYLSGVRVGFIGRLHLRIENERDLLKTYVCELDLDLIRQDCKIAKPYSKFPAITRDLSVLIPKSFDYNEIKNCIKNLNLEILEKFRLVDIYDHEDFKDSYSITINFTFRDLDKTLQDSEVIACMDKILQSIKDLGLDLR
ncbi:phenylalanine--tRNA ligase subunit beta [Campylobacter sp. VicNov18]|uniref:phenylalanine--tRNA ligase subunit beta n=1 Tax=Campylobacter bilis TaxID=2691918 RepID=UPI00130DD6CF|nr:phenylalanine--tRNA ligase subunit beta [Campylobacter bilis]MPV63519.1 phenylalanine--tRNA ligase subunit beta [Campylobacter hepaticus]MBM0637019.1 phenylalanine--tRNA ligase subunit beta [Campylobacter bilis]MCC8277825.1 phenylalanine--tRNA ligase subunit beta [Campylobacter bilis]MCC8299435.1 phenylalanine--tRNA ligase subunit beta [Campylobacter bilis]MCC8300735.1 phenylalanine--tRNA ligase subunit beta [Campylobacter bilis]